MSAATHTIPAPPFQAEAERIVADQQARRDAHHSGGVSWSAMARNVPEVASVEEVRLRLVAEHERKLAWLATPRGRVFTATQELKALGYSPDLYPAHQVLLACEPSAGSARFAHLTPENILAAVKVVNAIQHSTARDLVAALCDLAAEAGVRRAA